MGAPSGARGCARLFVEQTCSDHRRLRTYSAAWGSCRQQPPVIVARKPVADRRHPLYCRCHGLHSGPFGQQPCSNALCRRPQSLLELFVCPFGPIQAAVTAWQGIRAGDLISGQSGGCLHACRLYIGSTPAEHRRACHPNLLMTQLTRRCRLGRQPQCPQEGHGHVLEGRRRAAEDPGRRQAPGGLAGVRKVLPGALCTHQTARGSN